MRGSKAKGLADQTPTGPNIWEDLDLDDEIFDDYEEYNPSTCVFTANKTGRYFLNCQLMCRFTNVLANTIVLFQMRVVDSGVTVSYLNPKWIQCFLGVVAVADMVLHGHTVVDLVKNDTLKMQGYYYIEAGGCSTISHLLSQEPYSWFTVLHA